MTFLWVLFFFFEIFLLKILINLGLLKRNVYPIILKNKKNVCVRVCLSTLLLGVFLQFSNKCVSQKKFLCTMNIIRFLQYSFRFMKIFCVMQIFSMFFFHLLLLLAIQLNIWINLFVFFFLHMYGCEFVDSNVF